MPTITTGTEPFQERSFKANYLNIAAKIWHSDAKTGVIAVHGWLDNANSFDVLAPLLEQLNIVALDSAGHGKSDFRSPDAQYLIWSEVGEIMEIADQMGWERFALMGHSRGAGICSLAAGTFPERISHLVLLEGGIPLPITPAQIPENLAQSIVDTRHLHGAKGTLFSTREKAIAARADGFTKVSIDAAETLAKRSLLKNENGFYWHADARLKAPSSLKLGDPQIDAFLRRIAAPTLFAYADKGIVKEMNFSRPHMDQIPLINKLELPGGHHFHMEESAGAISEAITGFLSKPAR